MDPKELRGLYEAYSEVYAPQQIDEISQKTATSAYAKRRTGEFEGDDASDRVAKTNKLKGRIEKKFGKEAGKHADRAADVETFGRKDASGRRKQSPQPRIQTSDHENQREFKRELRIKRDRRLRAARGEDTNEQVNIFDTVLEFLQAEGFAETLEEAEWMMANVIDEEAIEIILGEEQLDEISLKTKMGAYARSQDPDADYQYGSKVHAQGERIKKAIVKKHGSEAGKHADAHADAEHWGRRDKKTGKPQAHPKPRIEKNRTYRTTKAGKMHGQDQAKLKSDLKYKRSSRTEEYMDEAQAARENPEGHDREEKKKYAPVRGERTPMPPRGDKRREDFEKWYAANVR